MSFSNSAIAAVTHGTITGHILAIEILMSIYHVKYYFALLYLVSYLGADA
jgi:hypothetical protein